MPKCPNDKCGADNPDGAWYCHRCGERVWAPLWLPWAVLALLIAFCAALVVFGLRVP